MIQEEIQKQTAETKAIYTVYLDKLLQLKKKQDKIIRDFSEILKHKKIENLKKSVNAL